MVTNRIRVIDLETIEGIVLKKINYKEHSKIIHIYTRDGLKSVLMHGSNKISSPYLKFGEILSEVKLNVSGKNLKTLRDGDLVKDFRTIKEDITKYTYLTHVLELVYYFSSHEHDHEKLYNFLLKVIDKTSAEEDYIPYINMLEAKLLYLLGVNPELDSCVECGSTERLSFSIKAGGMTCVDHRQGDENFSNETIDVLKFLYYFDMQNPTEFKIEAALLKEIRNLLDKYYEYHLNYRSKSRKILIGLIGY